MGRWEDKNVRSEKYKVRMGVAIIFTAATAGLIFLGVMANMMNTVGGKFLP